MGYIFNDDETIKHTPEWTSICRNCAGKIGWNREAVGRSGKLYPLEANTGLRHICPNSDYARNRKVKETETDEQILDAVRGAVERANQCLRGFRVDLDIREVV